MEHLISVHGYTGGGVEVSVEQLTILRIILTFFGTSWLRNRDSREGLFLEKCEDRSVLAQCFLMRA